MQAVAMMMLLLWAGYEDLAVFGSHLAQDRLVVISLPPFWREVLLRN
jgi:hypothetical protein